MVWVLERPSEAIPHIARENSSVWDVIEETSHFTVQEKKSKQVETENCEFCNQLTTVGGGQCILCGEKDYRIIYVSTISLVVAKSDCKQEILEHMKCLKVNIQPMLRILQQDNSKKPQTKLVSERSRRKVKELFSLSPRSPKHSKKSITETEEPKHEKPITDFVKLKVASFIKDDEQFQKKFTSLLNEDKFKSYFTSNEEEETTEICKKLKK